LDAQLRHAWVKGPEEKKRRCPKGPNLMSKRKKGEPF